jgi:hypothetical protein
MSSALENNRDMMGDFLSRIGDMDGKIASTKLDNRYIYEPCTAVPLVSAADQADGTILAAGTTARGFRGSTPSSSWTGSPCGTTQTLAGPFRTTDGWAMAGDLTNNDIMEYGPAGYTLADCPQSFVVGSDEACFFRCKFKVADVSGSDLTVMGFRKQEAANGTFTSYTDYAVIGHVSGDIVIKTELNSGGTTTVDTTQNWADGETHTLVVKVSAAGVVTFEVDGAAPTVTTTFTFDTGDRIVPVFYILHDATSPGQITWREVEVGPQPSRRVALV